MTLRGLRILLVAAAALSTVLVGLRESLADARAAGMAIRCLDGAAFDGSREDDSGTRSEQVEEDDSEEQEDREVHLFATTSLTCHLDLAIGAAVPPPRSSTAARRCVATLGRGPPTGC